jgi:hypothetical protein
MSTQAAHPRRHHAAHALTVVVATLLLAAPARAQDDEGPIPEARYIGFGTDNKQVVGSGSTAGAYFAMTFGALLCIGVLFKNARRTHLD